MVFLGQERHRASEGVGLGVRQSWGLHPSEEAQAWLRWDRPAAEWHWSLRQEKASVWEGVAGVERRGGQGWMKGADAVILS